MPSAGELLAPFAYPEPLVACVEEVAAWVDRHLPVSRLLLLGSTARGEASWHVYRGRVSILSDLEFYLLSARPLRSGERRSLSEILREWGMSWAFPNPFFHIDINVNPEALFWPKLRFDRRIATYEVISNAVVLLGDDFERQAHAFDVDELDLGNTNELVLVRLWMQLLFTPTRVVLGQADDVEWLVLKYALCRNLLEVLTILLPNLGVLLPSYSHREEYFRNHEELHHLLPAGAVAVQRACLEAKLHLHMPLEWSEYYAQLLRQYMTLLGFLVGSPLREPSPSADGVHAIAERVIASRGAFMRDGWLPRTRRVRRGMRLAMCYLHRHGPLTTLQWVQRPRRGLIIAFLLYMHCALFELLQGERGSALSGAQEVLTAVDPAFSTRWLPADARGQWLELRRSFIQFMSWWQYNDRLYLGRWGVAEWVHD